MKKICLVLSTLFLASCANFADDGDYSDAIQSVKERSNFTEIKGKAFTTSDILVSNSQILNSAANITAIFPKQGATNIESSYVAMSMTYFKTYNLYEEARYNGKSVPLKAYKVTSETCNDNCTTTQYVTFPIDMATLEKAKTEGLEYQIATSNDSSVVEYKIPAGYIQAIFNEGAEHSNATLQVGAPKSEISKPQEMVEYWYQEAEQAEKEAFSSWAFQNRKQVSADLKTTGKPSEMLDYWYKKASEEQRSQILTWLLKVE
ncbi:hypothetical protein [Vibrio litoralis]|uniref:hypothetical protein n=1 Tax=Vibrio litoralis TaxID=335972 RepID=UPI00048A154F|nr:hypothetical protein [Vibrio litoralis]